MWTVKNIVVKSVLVLCNRAFIVFHNTSEDTVLRIYHKHKDSNVGKE